MSSHLHTYIGPFLKVKLPEENKPITKTNKLSICVNAECKNYKKDRNAKFCSSCGCLTEENITTDTTHSIHVISAYELLEEFGDLNLLWSLGDTEDKFEWMLPNSQSIHSLRIDNSVDEMEMKIPDENIAILNFNRIYANFIKFLTDKKIEFEIHFSVINYWN